MRKESKSILIYNFPITQLETAVLYLVKINVDIEQQCPHSASGSMEAPALEICLDQGCLHIHVAPRRTSSGTQLCGELPGVVYYS